MDIEEARDVAKMGWPENQKAQRQHDAVDWLIAEVEALTAENARIFAMVDARDQTIAELTALCDEYRGEIERLTNRLAEYKRDYLKAQWREDRLKDARDRAESKVKELQSALTRARAKGMEDAIEVAEEVVTAVSVFATSAEAHTATVTKTRIIDAIRAAKGEQ